MATSLVNFLSRGLILVSLWSCSTPLPAGRVIENIRDVSVAAPRDGGVVYNASISESSVPELQANLFSPRAQLNHSVDSELKPYHDKQLEVGDKYDRGVKSNADEIAGTVEPSRLYEDQGLTEQPLRRAYERRRSVGDIGARASLYNDQRGAVNDIYQDYRAAHVGDIITVVITELAEGNRIANTNAKRESTFVASIAGLLGIDTWFFGKNSNIDPTAVVSTDTESEFKGQGQMLRSDRLRGTVSALVTRVLPTGVLEIEGKKVIQVNEEEQVMVLSGLVRPRDVTTANTVESSKVANMRIDFFGKGTLGDIQRPGWFVQVLGWLWPF